MPPTIGGNVMAELQHSSFMESGWCEPVKGLAGRLRVALEDLQPGLRHAVYLELFNHSSQALAVTDQPRIQAELLDKLGNSLTAAGMAMSGPIPAQQWGIIPAAAYLGFRIDMRTVGVPTREQGRALLALGGQAWELVPGRYTLKVDLTFKNDPAGPPHQWVGRLRMSPLQVVVALSAAPQQ
jgi:hypothetical protein